MKSIAFLFIGVLFIPAVCNAQVEFISDSYFPADLEFQELQEVISDEVFEDPSDLSKIADGDLIASVGFEKYAKRIYSTDGKGTLSIEVMTLKDSLAAYSLLTLLRDSDLQNGPPGDIFAATADCIFFAQGRLLIRIRGRSVPQDLIKRVAVSVSNRIGPARSKAPSLISYLPELGYVASSLRYFPNIESYQIYSRGKKDSVLNLDSDVEIARARYNLASHAGMLFLLSFPTAPAAKDFYSSPVIFKPKGSKGNNLYSKQAGPLVAVLQGDFEPASADKILNSLEYHYSIKWVYDKNNQSEVIWGVPAVILRTVVNSIIFVVLLCIVSIVIGFGFAVLRFKLRGHASKESIHKNEQNEFIRLRLR